MRCPRQFASLRVGGDDGKPIDDCVSCQNYFFGECLGGDNPRYIYRLPNNALSIFMVEITEHLEKKTHIPIYAVDQARAEAIADSETQDWHGKLMRDHEGTDPESVDIDVNVYLASDAKKADYVAYEGQIFSIEDFAEFVKTHGFDEDEEVPVIAESG